MRLLLAMAVAAAALVGLARPAAACSCVGFDDGQALARADAAFVGVVEDVGQPGWFERSDAPVTVTFQAERVFKGDVNAIQPIATVASSASCGLEVDVGVRYLVFAGAEDDGLEAGLCGGTRTIDINEQPEGFPATRRPVPAPPGTDDRDLPAITITAAAGAAAAVGGGALLALRRRRRAAA